MTSKSLGMTSNVKNSSNDVRLYISCDETTWYPVNDKSLLHIEAGCKIVINSKRQQACKNQNKSWIIWIVVHSTLASVFEKCCEGKNVSEKTIVQVPDILPLQTCPEW